MRFSCRGAGWGHGAGPGPRHSPARVRRAGLALPLRCRCAASSPRRAPCRPHATIVGPCPPTRPPASPQTAVPGQGTGATTHVGQLRHEVEGHVWGGVLLGALEERPKLAAAPRQRPRDGVSRRPRQHARAGGALAGDAGDGHAAADLGVHAHGGHVELGDGVSRQGDLHELIGLVVAGRLLDRLAPARGHVLAGGVEEGEAHVAGAALLGGGAALLRRGGAGLERLDRAPLGGAHYVRLRDGTWGGRCGAGKQVVRAPLNACTPLPSDAWWLRIPLFAAHTNGRFTSFNTESSWFRAGCGPAGRAVCPQTRSALPRATARATRPHRARARRAI